MNFYEQMQAKANAKAAEMAILELSCWDGNPAKHEASLKEYKINPAKRRKELELLAQGKRVQVAAHHLA